MVSWYLSLWFLGLVVLHPDKCALQHHFLVSKHSIMCINAINAYNECNDKQAEANKHIDKTSKTHKHTNAMFSTCACRSTYVGPHAGPLKLPFRPTPASADAPSPPMLCRTAAHMCNACSAAPQLVDGEVYTYLPCPSRTQTNLTTHSYGRRWLTPLAAHSLQRQATRYYGGSTHNLDGSSTRHPTAMPLRLATRRLLAPPGCRTSAGT